jgi:hypothetical protein
MIDCVGDGALTAKPPAEQLKQWRTAFVRTHGRQPSQSDVGTDPFAGSAPMSAALRTPWIFASFGRFGRHHPKTRALPPACFHRRPRWDERDASGCGGSCGTYPPSLG